MRLNLDTPVEEFGHTWTFWHICCVQVHTPIEGPASVIFEYCLGNDELIWPEVFRVSSDDFQGELGRGNSFRALQQAIFAALRSLANRRERAKARL